MSSSKTESPVNSGGNSDVEMDTSDSGPSSPVLSRAPWFSQKSQEHPRYHFHDGSVTFEVDRVKYRVHASLFALHCGFTSSWAEDLRDPSLVGISGADIDRFLVMLYTPAYQAHEIPSAVDYWTSILRTATRWEASGMREAAIRALGVMIAPHEKLLLSRTYDIKDWLISSFAAFTLRDSPFATTEIEIFGQEWMARILRARMALSKGLVQPTEAGVASWLSNDISGLSPSSSSHSISPAPTVHNELSTQQSLQERVPTETKTTKNAEHATMSASAPPFQPRPKIRLLAPQDAFLRRQYDKAFSLLTAGSEAAVAETVAPLLFDTKGVLIKPDLLNIARAAIRRAIAQPDFTPIGAQFLASLSTGLRGTSLRNLIRPDLRTLAAMWTSVLQGANPTSDPEGLMPDPTLGRIAYLQAIDNGREFCKALIRFSVIPAKDKTIKHVVG